MSDLLLPTHLRHARTSFRYLDNTGVSRGEYTRAVKTAAKGGDGLAATIELTKHGGRSTEGRSDRAVMRAFLASLRGRQNRAYLFDKSYRRRGSMSISELLLNGTFQNGITSWSESNPGVTLSAADRVLRVRRADGANSTAIRNTQSISVTANAAYLFRAFAVPGRGATGVGLRVGTTLGGTEVAESAVSSSGGMLSLLAVPAATTVYASLVDSFSGRMAGDYTSFPYTSFARCALADNAANLLTRSDEFDNATWTKIGVTIGTNSTVAPDGTTTMDGLIEDSATSAHMVTQEKTGLAAAATDYTIAVEVTPGNRLYCFLQMDEGGSTTVTQYFNLSAGTVASGSTGVGWANRRAAIVDLGDDRFMCVMTARKTSSATTIKAYIGIGESDGVGSYTGNGSGTAIAIRRGGVSPSSVFTRVGQTTSAATTGTAQAGSAIYTKGWPASTDGLLLADDQMEIVTSRGSELKILTAPVNSDAAGLAYMQFEPPLRGTPADNAPIILHQPMMRAIYAGESVGWDNDPGYFTSASVEFEEAPTPA